MTRLCSSTELEDKVHGLREEGRMKSPLCQGRKFQLCGKANIRIIPRAGRESVWQAVVVQVNDHSLEAERK